MIGFVKMFRPVPEFPYLTNDWNELNVTGYVKGKKGNLAILIVTLVDLLILILWAYCVNDRTNFVSRLFTLNGFKYLLAYAFLGWVFSFCVHEILHYFGAPAEIRKNKLAGIWKVKAFGLRTNPCVWVNAEMTRAQMLKLAIFPAVLTIGCCIAILFFSAPYQLFFVFVIMSNLIGSRSDFLQIWLVLHEVPSGAMVRYFHEKKFAWKMNN